MNMVDLFCGCGGLSGGLEMAGFRCLLGVDSNRTAIATFKRNHPGSAVYLGDIGKLTNNRIDKLIGGRKINLVAGGPPCQGMSTVGEGIPDDPRNYLFLQFVRIVRHLKPEYILMENVTGMLGRKNEKIVTGIMGEFAKLGYNLDAEVISAHNHGVPQKRRRTIFIGNRMGYKNLFPKVGINGRTVGDALKNLRAPDGKIYNHDVINASISNSLERERISHIPEGGGIRYERDEKKYLPKRLRLDVDWKNMRERRFRQTKYRKLSRGEHSPTIMTGRHSYYHPIENRYLTVREAAALQSFPNDFVFEGSVTQQWRQVGNAVPVLLAKALGEAILKTDEQKKRIKEKPNIMKIRGTAFNYRCPHSSQKPLTKFT